MDTEILVFVCLIGQLIGGTLAMTICCFRFARGLEGSAEVTVRGVGCVMAVGLILIVLLGGLGMVGAIWSFPLPDWHSRLTDTPEVFLILPVAVGVLAVRCAWGVHQGDRAWMRPGRGD